MDSTSIESHYFDHTVTLAISRIVKAQQKEGRSTCEECNFPIPAARLAVAPWATKCVPCQKLAETVPKTRRRA